MCFYIYSKSKSPGSSFALQYLLDLKKKVIELSQWQGAGFWWPFWWPFFWPFCKAFQGIKWHQNMQGKSAHRCLFCKHTPKWEKARMFLWPEPQAIAVIWCEKYIACYPTTCSRSQQAEPPSTHDAASHAVSASHGQHSSFAEQSAQYQWAWKTKHGPDALWERWVKWFKMESHFKCCFFWAIMILLLLILLQLLLSLLISNQETRNDLFAGFSEHIWHCEMS